MELTGWGNSWQSESDRNTGARIVTAACFAESGNTLTFRLPLGDGKQQAESVTCGEKMDDDGL